MRIVGEILLHLLCAQGLRETDMLDSIKKFRNGKWEKLWGKVIKASNKLKCKRAANPAQPRARTAYWSSEEGEEKLDALNPKP